MAVLALLAAMLIIMVMRVGLPIGAKTEGRVVRQIALSFRERVLMQRTNVYAIGFVLLLTAATGMLPTAIELLVILGVFALLMIPVRLKVTTSGIAVNNVVYRPLSEFSGVQPSRRGLRFVAQPGVRNLDVPLLGAHREEALRVIHLPRTDRGAGRGNASRGARKGR
jgi:hypothetical protein